MNKRKPGRPKTRTEPIAPPTSYRFTSRHRFALNLLAKQTSSNQVAALQQAIEIAVRELGLSRSWEALYNDDEVIATLNLYALQEYRVDDTEKQRRQFIFAHNRFFYTDAKRTQPHAVFARILWPKIDEYAAKWFEHLHDDYNIAARAMAADIKKAGRTPPPIEVDR
jgi:hypothetical protein